MPEPALLSGHLMAGCRFLKSVIVVRPHAGEPEMPSNDHNTYMRRWYRKRMDTAIRLLGGACVRCGETTRLEIDHIDPRQKIGTVSTLYSNAGVLADELKKCQLLCHGCHLAKTISDLPPLDHGTVGMYETRKCRCDTCRRFYALYRRRFRPALARRQWQADSPGVGKYDAPVRESAMALRNGGASLTAVAKACGVSRATVWNWEQETL